MVRALAMAGLLALGLSACGGGAGSRPSVLLITVDSLRADRLGCYGNERGLTPALDALAAEGVRFDRAYAHAPFTSSSHASLLTSRHVPSHGVLGWAEALPDGAEPMGERFSKAGYRTGAFYNHPSLQRTDVARGFEEVQSRTFEDARTTLDAFLEWVDEDPEEPFASWIHLWDVHRPYAYRDWTLAKPHYPELERPEGQWRMSYGEDRFGPPADVRVGRRNAHYDLNAQERGGTVSLGGETRPWTAADFGYIVDRYDAGVAHADAELGRLFDQLEDRGIADDLLLIVTSDHGEALDEWEACYFAHDPFLYEETLRVPLLIRFPRQRWAGRTVGATARHVDVLPTMLELARMDPSRVEGRSVLQLLDDRPDDPVVVFAQTQSKEAKERSAIAADLGLDWVEERLMVSDGRYKLIRDVTAGGTDQLFDLESDEGERNDLSEDPFAEGHRRRLSEILSKLQARFRRLEAIDTSELSEEELAQLQYLGYFESDEDPDEDLEQR